MSNNHQESPSDHLVTSSEAVVSKIMIELQQVNSMLKEQMERQKAQTDILSSLVAGFDVQRQNTVLFGDDDDDDGDGDGDGDGGNNNNDDDDDDDSPLYGLLKLFRDTVVSQTDTPA